MCTVCGCGSDTVHIEGALQHSEPEQHTHAEPEQQSRRIQVEQDILAKNNHYAAHNRARFEAQQLLVLNLLSSPGSGKTTLLVETLKQLQSYCPLAVIEGDQQSSQDAERIRATGIPAIQINTGKGCHLDAHMVGHAAAQLADLHDGMLFIENVGNLVCPAAFGLGEGFKVAILSVTEGEDKPLKYPDIFYAADLMILNKIDLLPYLDFDIERCKSYARQINPDLTILELSATTGEGLESWLDWLEQQRVRV